jgi:hypothetical protein
MGFLHGPLVFELLLSDGRLKQKSVAESQWVYQILVNQPKPDRRAGQQRVRKPQVEVVNHIHPDKFCGDRWLRFVVVQQRERVRQRRGVLCFRANGGNPCGWAGALR